MHIDDKEYASSVRGQIRHPHVVAARLHPELDVSACARSGESHRGAHPPCAHPTERRDASRHLPLFLALAPEE
eukprot:2089161-Pleurochrysis_carterae.AAC.1